MQPAAPERIAYKDCILKINTFNATFTPNFSDFTRVDQFFYKESTGNSLLSCFESADLQKKVFTTTLNKRKF